MDFLIGAFTYVVPFLCVLTVVVFFHELGHFLVGRWCGVRVESFSIGFGPEIGGWTDKHGTRWRVSWIPLGGYVKFLGDQGAASTPDRDKLQKIANDPAAREAFHFKPVWKRAAIVAAGPMANFILAVVIFGGIFMTFGEVIVQPRVEKVNEGSAAEAAGIKAGDIIVEIQGREIHSFSDLQRIVSANANVPLDITVDRNGDLIEFDATPRRETQTDRFGNEYEVGILGIQRSVAEEAHSTVRYAPPMALWRGVEESAFVAERTLTYIWRVVLGREKADQIGGPLRIAQVSGQVAQVSVVALINLAAILSVTIGLINLFPVPMLDGGHLAYYAYEAVAGRPMSERFQEMGFRIGLALVLMLMLFATWNDLNHFKIFN